MNESEINYLNGRADEEMERAMVSNDPIAASLHRRLSSLYAGRAAEGNEQSILNIVTPTTTA